MAIINATMVAPLLPSKPMGSAIQIAYQTDGDPWITVVGVVGDMHRDGITRDPVSRFSCLSPNTLHAV